MRRCLLVLGVACSTPPSHPAPPQPDAPAARPCELSGRWRDQPDELWIGPNGPTFATVFGVERGTLEFASSVSARVITPTLELAGFVDPQRVQLHARKPFVIAGFLIPGPKLPLRYAGTRSGRLEIDVAPASLTKALHAERACSDLALDAGTFDPRSALPERSQRMTSLAAGRDIPLSIEPGAAPIAMLHYENSPLVDVLATRGAEVRVAVLAGEMNPSDNFVAFGWVPASAVLEISQGMGGSWGRGGMRGTASRPPSKRPHVVCARDIGLRVQLDRDVRPVGHIRPNTIIELLDDNDPVEVSILRAHAELAEGAHWLVSRAELADCSTPP
jgi:hypothetical protein